MKVILEQRFRENLKQALEARDWSQSDLARAMGVTPQFVSKCIRGECAPGLDVIERFSKAFGMSDPVELLLAHELQPNG